MNERIVKLITEADAYAWTISEKYVPECGEVNYLWEDAFRKKFAELIVRECIGCCEQVISDPVPKSVDTWLNGGSQCIKEIKERFGVEGMSTEDKKTLIKELLGLNNV
jgi:hypothetical protein